MYTLSICILRHGVSSLVCDTCRMTPEQARGGSMTTHSMLKKSYTTIRRDASKRIWLLNLKLFLVLRRLILQDNFQLPLSVFQQEMQWGSQTLDRIFAQPSSFCTRIEIIRCILYVKVVCGAKKSVPSAQGICSCWKLGIVRLSAPLPSHWPRLNLYIIKRLCHLGWPISVDRLFSSIRIYLSKGLDKQCKWVLRRQSDELYASIVPVGTLRKSLSTVLGSLQQIWSKGFGAFVEGQNHWCFRSPCSSKDDLEQHRPEIGIDRSYTVHTKTRFAFI